MSARLPSNSSLILEQAIAQRLRAYYTRHYRDVTGLPNWEEHVEKRLHNENDREDLITKFEGWTGQNIGKDLDVLVVGAGTGSATLRFNERACSVQSLDPDVEAVRIGRMRLKQRGFDERRFNQGSAENLPFSSETFGLVWCHTVIEHVSNVEKSIWEMVRVAKPGGYVFIAAPDYRICYEPHYKIHMPTFAPLFIKRLWLWMKGRPTRFIQTINFVTSNRLADIFQNLPVTSFLVFQPSPRDRKLKAKIYYRYLRFMSRYLGARSPQLWILQKSSVHTSFSEVLCAGGGRSHGRFGVVARAVLQYVHVAARRCRGRLKGLSPKYWTQCRPPRVVYFTGLPRSGTTMIKRLMGAHPDVAIAEGGGGYSQQWQDARSRSPGKVVFAKSTRMIESLDEAATDFGSHAWFVFVLRDPRDAYASLLETGVHQEIPRSKEYWTEWSRRVGLFLRFGAKTGQKYTGTAMIRYEDVIADPAFVKRAFLEWLGLDTSTILTEYEPVRELATGPWLGEDWKTHQHTHPHFQSVGRWQREDDPRAVEVIHAWKDIPEVRDLMMQFGYGDGRKGVRVSFEGIGFLGHHTDWEVADNE